MDPQWIVEREVYSQHRGHMTKMAAMAIYGKNSLKIFFRTKGRMALGLGMQHWGRALLAHLRL